MLWFDGEYVFCFFLLSSRLRLFHTRASNLCLHQLRALQRHVRRRGLATNNEVRAHTARSRRGLVPHGNQVEGLHDLVHVLGDVHAHGGAGALHLVGEHNRVAPQIIGNFLEANHTGDGGTRVDTKTHAERMAVVVDLVVFVKSFEHVQCTLTHSHAVVDLGLVQAPDDEVGITDCLDLLDLQKIANNVELTEDVVQEFNHLRRAETATRKSKVHKVREENGHILVLVGDGRLSGLEALGDLLGKNVLEQSLALLEIHLCLLRRVDLARLQELGDGWHGIAHVVGNHAEHQQGALLLVGEFPHNRNEDNQEHEE
eukprot:PhM_4_TR17459/c0_g1_i2/m.36770